ncbi:hypothetical protein BH11BAC2_BH11BAC2_21630 [soil metagenome]
MHTTSKPFFDRDTLLHLRLPFSFFLLPIFCFALSQAGSIEIKNSFLLFISLHFFIYPGSNIYNSYMDDDKGSIGGLKNPPAITRKLYTTSIIFDSIGLILCVFINFHLLLFMSVYILVSKAYSWKGIRLKKYGVLGWLTVILFQGGFTFLLVNMTAENNFGWTWFQYKQIEGMVLATLLIGGFYPLTQIYQHEEDSTRGDFTISYLLGIRGTFIFSGILFLTSFTLALHYFSNYYSITQFYIFLTCILPVTFYFLNWFWQSWKNEENANYSNTMKMTFLSSTLMILCYCILLYQNHGS